MELLSSPEKAELLRYRRAEELLGDTFRCPADDIKAAVVRLFQVYPATPLIQHMLVEARKFQGR